MSAFPCEAQQRKGHDTEPHLTFPGAEIYLFVVGDEKEVPPEHAATAREAGGFGAEETFGAGRAIVEARAPARAAAAVEMERGGGRARRPVTFMIYTHPGG